MLQTEIERFKTFDLNQVVHINQDVNFNDKRQSLDEMYKLFAEIVPIVEQISFDRAVTEPLDRFLMQFNNLLEQLLNHSVLNDSNLSKFKALKNSIDTNYRYFFRLNPSENPNDPNTRNSDLPLIYNLIKVRSLDINSVADDSTTKLKEIENAAIQQINSLETKVNGFINDGNNVLSLLNKQAGKIGVEKFAEIFDKQAEEHSRVFKRWFGKAQYWLAFGILAFGVLILFFFKLDSIFSIKGASSFSPEVTVHVVGRFLLISLFIFIVSFSFKQFRINMHLYTLNKHRANTLKSFEYLTRAPDKLDPSSYNAILMEVAKSIYEAGQTGYINVNEGQADMPSIVDLSKIITQPKTS